MKVGGMGQLSFGSTRSPNVKAGCDKASWTAALATEHAMKRAGEHPPDITATSAHTDGNTINSIILKREGSDKCFTNKYQPQTNGFLESRAEKNNDQIH